MKAQTISLLAMAIATALAQSASAGAITHELVITENSSASLSVIYDGSSSGVLVTPVTSDQWTVVLANEVFLNAPDIQWTEPEGNGLVNFLDIAQFGTNAFSVFSDHALNAALGSSPDGTRLNFALALDQVPVFVTFHDNAQAAETVPETGSSLSLLALSMVALAGLSRRYFAPLGQQSC